jgi:hemoglobin
MLPASENPAVSDPPEMPVYERIGGEAIAAVVAGFYRRVPQDEVLQRLYPAHDLAGAEQRLREFLIYRLGGPPTYLHTRGHPRLRMRHQPFAIDRRARDRWMAAMTEALEEQDLPGDVREYLQGFLADIATFLINQP